MFDEYYTEFWSKKEISYQHVHMFWAFWLSYALYHITGNIYFPAFSGLLFGICLECYQYRKYIVGLEIPKTWTDSIRDMCFWWLGGCLNYILIVIGA